MQNQTTRSNWWFLLPIFLNICGGVIAYFVLRHDDPPKAKNCLILGAVLVLIHVISGFVIGIPLGFFWDLGVFEGSWY